LCYLYTTSGNAVDALSEKIEVSMYDLAGLVRIADAFLRAFGQAEMVVYCLEQNGARKEM
jgi:hypothetical protein